MQILEYILQHKEAATLLFTFVVALSTVCYAFLTWSLVSETKKLRETQTEPKIAAWVELTKEFTPLAYLRIQNIGLGSAFNIRFQLTDEAKNPGGQLLIKDFLETSFLNTGIEYLGPEQELSSRAILFRENLEEEIEAVLTVKIKYRSTKNQEYTDTYRLDMAELRSYSNLGEQQLQSIASSLKGIERKLDRLKARF